MESADFEGVRVLVVEDELLVALNLETLLLESGCEVIGPIGSLHAALKATSDGESPDLAILDINLRGEHVYPLAEKLRDRGVPLIFCSGYTDVQTLPEPFRACTKLGKPYGAAEIRDAMRRVLATPEADRVI